jgi:hypothetical protein
MHSAVAQRAMEKPGDVDGGAGFFVCPPEGGACSSWIKYGFSHSLRQRLQQRLRGVTEKWFGRVG